MSIERKVADYHARQARLKRVADNIERGENGKFFGADFHLGFNYLFGEIIQLQREFNERFSVDMPGDPRFAEFYDRIVQILESSEIVLIDSINPVENKKAIAARNQQSKQSDKKSIPFEKTKPKDKQAPLEKPNSTEKKK